MHSARLALSSVESSKNPAEVLAEKIKLLEGQFESKLATGKPFVVRLDGVAFRTFTKTLQKPFDPRFTQAMIQTTMDLAQKFHSLTSFCQSDEITLIIGNEEGPNPTAFYNNRVSKIVSVIASFAGVRFNWHLSKAGVSLHSDNLPFFDARAFSADYQTAADAVYWRHKYDCRRNAINSIGFHKLSHKETVNVSLPKVVAKLAENGIDVYQHFPKSALYGVFVKKIMKDHVGMNPKTGEQIIVQRSRIEPRVFDWNGSPEERTDFVSRKLWIDSDPKSQEDLEFK